MSNFQLPTSVKNPKPKIAICGHNFKLLTSVQNLKSVICVQNLKSFTNLLHFQPLLIVDDVSSRLVACLLFKLIDQLEGLDTIAWFRGLEVQVQTLCYALG